MKKGLSFLALAVIISMLALEASAVVIETNEILINEFVTEPQTDWDQDNQTSSTDEWIELYNPGLGPMVLENWKLQLIDESNASQSLNGTISAKGFLIIQNPLGAQMNEGRIELYDSTDTLVDSVTYGNFDDGNISDNAPKGNSATIYDECIARFPNGANSDIDSQDFTKALCTYQSLNNFTLVPINITDLPAQPSCVFETDNIQLSAEISGSISQVSVLINTGSGWETINIPGTQGGTYTYIINSSELQGNSIVQWQFLAEDLTGNETFGEMAALEIKSRTSLQVFPPQPDGLNGWYITQPLFELSNPDNDTIFYRWNGVSFFYNGLFGLEGTPNNGNITGGTLALNYRSNFTELNCSEEEQEFMANFDFKNPEFKDLYPQPDTTVFNEGQTTISAYIDEVFQGNSGVNLQSVRVELNGVEVPAEANYSGTVDAEVSYTGDLPDGQYEVDIYVEDLAGRSSATSWSFELITLSDFSMELNMPTEGIYMDRRLPFNISLTREAEELYYINYADPNPREKRLCRYCDEFGYERKRLKSLREGQNDIVFKALDSMGNAVEQEVSLTIDSKEPRIRRTEPRSGLASGLFEIEFEEENPDELSIFYGTVDGDFEEQEISIDEECDLDREYACTATVDLSDYDGTEIEYYVKLEDVAGNVDESRPRTLDVDMSFPTINSFSYEVEGRYATFTLDVDEPYLDEIVYIDTLDNRPRERRLCNRLDEGVCEARVSFDEGDHDVTITVKDEAGNEATAFAEFFTDSRDPRIKRIEPRRGFASGVFTLKYEEVNPASAYLTYGNLFEERYAELNLDDCEPDRKNMICEIETNLSDFEEQEIEYRFNLTDIAGNTDESRPERLSVDTLPPIVTQFNYTMDDGRVDFTIGIDDPNFDEVLYKDRDDNNPRFRRLCSRLDEEICERTLRFRNGEHTLDIIALDEAGNEATVAENLEFTVM